MSDYKTIFLNNLSTSNIIEDYELDLNNQSHRRYNPLIGEWILVSPHRAKRPWSGKVEITSLETTTSYDPNCYLCPGNQRISGEKNPQYQDTFVFTNDYSALQKDSPKVMLDDLLFKAMGACGISKVICFSPDHSATIPLLSLSQISKIIETWKKETEELGKEYPWIQVFENKGEMMGASQPHPHGQLWANSYLPNVVDKKNNQQKSYWQQHKSILLLDYVNQELSKNERIVFQTQYWVCVVPFWAQWPFEVMLLPKSHIPRFINLSAAQQEDLSLALKKITTRYDNVFASPFPYSMGWHYAPYLQSNDTNGDESMPTDYWQLHCSFYPPLLRSSTVKKFMVGYEMFAESQRDITPEQAAKILSEQSEIHYSQQSNQDYLNHHLQIKASQGFAKQFCQNNSAAANIFSYAPGRVNLIGEHTDYNGGKCMPCAIDFGIISAGRARQDSIFNVYADQIGLLDSFDVRRPIERREDAEYLWANYVRGVVKFFLEHRSLKVGADLFITGNIPLGSGLSSSAALELSIVQFCQQLAIEDDSTYQLLDRQVLALIGQQAENQFVGSNSGNMDQLSSMFGEEGYALELDCLTLELNRFQLPEGYKIVIINSGVKHSLVGNEYNQRREECKRAANFLGVEYLCSLTPAQFFIKYDELAKFDPIAAIRARHIVTENQRVIEASQAFATNNIAKLSELLYASHDSMRDDFAITIEEIDFLVATGKQLLADKGGIRMTGGGFGGCVVAIVPQQQVADFCQIMADKYRNYTELRGDKIDPDIYLCNPSQGARLLSNHDH